MISKLQATSEWFVFTMRAVILTLQYIVLLSCSSVPVLDNLSEKGNFWDILSGGFNFQYNSFCIDCHHCPCKLRQFQFARMKYARDIACFELPILQDWYVILYDPWIILYHFYLINLNEGQMEALTCNLIYLYHKHSVN